MTVLTLVALLLGTTQVEAQNVTAHPGNGSMLPALKSGQSDTFFGWNGFATWKHEQLALTITTGDSDNNSGTDADGNLARPANDIFATPKDPANPNAPRYLQIGKGRRYTAMTSDMETFITISIPKGYRFTGYNIIFHRIAYPTPDGATVSTSGGAIYINDTSNSNNAVDETTGNLAFGETDADFNYTSTSNTSGTYYGGIPQGNTDPQTLSRTSQSTTDMENVLYFKLTSTVSSGRAFIQLDHVEFYFTAENNYAPLIPAPNVTGQTAVDIPFTTSKMDYGIFSKRDINGKESGQSGYDANTARICYDGTIHDMNANLILYENGSTESIEAEDNDFDGIGGDIVKYDDNGSISQAGDYFKLKGSDHGQYNASAPGPGATYPGEVIYYIESPTWATNKASADAHKNPIGYRIIGASFDCNGGNLKFPAVFKIQYESKGHSADQNGIYGLNFYQNSLAYNWNYQTEWRIDDNGRIYVGNDYLRVTGRNGNYTLTTTQSQSQATSFEITTNNQIRMKNNTSYYIGWQETENGTYEWQDWNYVFVGDGTYTRSAVITNQSSQRATYTELSHAFSENIGQYTFLIYDETGTKVKKSVVVNGQEVKDFSIDGLNNDAVKIGVIGTGIIKGHVTLQALDPYIDHIDIVCQEDDGNGGKLTQQFNATDFSVRGGKFNFYVPADFKTPAKFTFDNLYSKYGDNTFYGNTASTNHGRYYFLGSTYSGYEENDVYARYNNTDYRNAPYTTKIKCEQPGNVPFTFNNAETASQTAGNQFEEYPFSLNLYDDANGEFVDFKFEQEEMDGETEKTAYLFTCDETKYNIAPTTATQHVYYAYYQMTITMEKHTYEPKLAWEPVYDETFGADNNDSKWGLKLTTEQVHDDQGDHSGYLTVTQILDYINGREAAAATYWEEGDDLPDGVEVGDEKTPEIEEIEAALGKEGAPSSMDQILYIDASDLMSIVENQTVKVNDKGNPVVVEGKLQYDSHSVNELITNLDKNALVYLPYGSKPQNDNFAYNTISQYGQTPIFRGAKDIVLTDKYSFFAPYDIQVESENKATYTREIIDYQNLYGQSNNGTIMLPFTLSLGANGVHTNPDGSTFTVNAMKPDDGQGKPIEMNLQPGSAVDHGTAFFTPLTSDEAAANTPYMIHVESRGTTLKEGENFVIAQKGSDIVATPKNGATNPTGTGWMHTGESATATFNSIAYNFTNVGTFSGAKFDRAAKINNKEVGENVFYFANNKFLDLHTLAVSAGQYLYLYPFRAAYVYEDNGAYSTASNAKKAMKWFDISFDEPNFSGVVTDINENIADADLIVRVSDGKVTLSATRSQDVNINTLSGMGMKRVALEAGDTQTVALPAGIYLINNVKVIVK